MSKPERFVFVCTNHRPDGHPRGSCAMNGGSGVITRFSEVIEGTGLSTSVSLIASDCMGQCVAGPIVSVFPDNYWYRGVTPTDVDEIVTEHLVKGRPVHRLALREEDWN